MERTIGILVIAIVFQGYYPTVQKGCPGGDSGELLAEACMLGVAHPPGYPLMIYFSRGIMEIFRFFRLGYNDYLSNGSSNPYFPSLDPRFYSPAYQVNLASSVIGAVSTGLLYATGILYLSHIFPEFSTLQRSLISTGISLAWAFSPLIWMYSISAEVFVLNNFFITLIIYLFTNYSVRSIIYLADPSISNISKVQWIYRYTSFSVFICGLALCNQHTSILLIIPTAVWILWSQYELVTVPQLGVYLLYGILGLLPYIHLPIAHMYWRNPGSWGDTSTIMGFFRHLLRSDYGTLRLLARADAQTENFGQRTVIYIRDLFNEQMPKGLAICFMISIVLSFTFLSRNCLRLRTTIRTGKKSVPNVSSSSSTKGGATKSNDKPSGSTVASSTAVPSSSSPSSSSVPIPSAFLHVIAVSKTFPLAITLFYTFYFLVFHNLSNMPLNDPLLAGVHARFWLQPNILAFLMAMGGIGYLVHWISLVLNRYVRASIGVVNTILLTILTFLIGLTFAGIQYYRNHVRMNLSDDDIMNKYGEALLKPLPKDAVLITSFDFQWTTTRYLQACEYVRPDISILNGPVMSYNWFRAQQSTYPKVRFPGTHLVGHMTEPHAEGGFSLVDFFIANTVPDGGQRYFESYVQDTPTGSNEIWLKGHAVRSESLQRTDCSLRSAAQFKQSSPSLGDSVESCTVHHNHGGIFHTGGLMFAKDRAHTHQFEWIPYGLMSKVIFKFNNNGKTIHTWQNTTSQSESRVEAHVIGTKTLLKRNEIKDYLFAYERTRILYNGTVNITQYDESTWEYATRVDYWNQMTNYGTWLLEWALASENHYYEYIPDLEWNNPSVTETDEEVYLYTQNGKWYGNRDPESIMNITGVIEAARILEEALLYQTAHHAIITGSLWKNLGLAYVKLVRYPNPFPSHIHTLPRLPHIGDKSIYMNEQLWRSHAAERVLDTWGYYLTLPESRSDSSYATISHVVQVLRQAAAKSSSLPSSSSTERSIPSGRTGTNSRSRSGSFTVDPNTDENTEPSSGRGNSRSRSSSNSNNNARKTNGWD